MKVTKHEQSLIHIVMEMCYEQGIEEGRRQAMEEIRAMKKSDNDLVHRPAKNTCADDWRRT